MRVLSVDVAGKTLGYSERSVAFLDLAIAGGSLIRGRMIHSGPLSTWMTRARLPSIRYSPGLAMLDARRSGGSKQVPAQRGRRPDVRSLWSVSGFAGSHRQVWLRAETHVVLRATSHKQRGSLYPRFSSSSTSCPRSSNCATGWRSCTVLMRSLTMNGEIRPKSHLLDVA